MEREQVTKLLEGRGLTVDQEHLTMSEPEVWLYLDWATRLQYTIVDPHDGTPIQVHTITFKEVEVRDAAQFDLPDDDQAIEDLGLCPVCFEPLLDCTCPEDTGDDWYDPSFLLL